jgi:hypothetical protein
MCTTNSNTHCQFFYSTSSITYKPILILSRSRQHGQRSTNLIEKASTCRVNMENSTSFRTMNLPSLSESNDIILLRYLNIQQYRLTRY